MTKHLTPLRWLILLLCISCPNYLSAQTNGILYVKKGSNGSGNSWSDAIGEVADALIKAKNTPAVQQIWVSGGTFKPMYNEYDNGQTYIDERLNIFLLVNNVKMYGGFAGTEQTLQQRDLSLEVNRTVLSGDIDNNDHPNGAIIGNNVYHILLMNKEGGNCFLDGFTVQGALSNGDGSNGVDLGWVTIYSNIGGGLITIRANSTINNCVFRGNKAKMISAFFGLRSSQQISNTIFVGNSTDEIGTVLFDESYAVMSNCTVSGNYSGSSGWGTVVSNSAIVNIHNSVFFGNNIDLSGDYFKISNSIIKDGHTGTNNSTADPLFMEMPSYTQAPFTNGNYKLRPASPALNAGNNEFTVDPFSGNRMINAMADQYIAANCVKPGCSITNPEQMVSNDDLDDFVELGAAEFNDPFDEQSWIEIGWTNRPAADATWMGLIVSDEQGILSAENLPNVIVGKVNPQPGDNTYASMFELKTITIGGKEYKLLSGVNMSNPERVKISVQSRDGSLSSIRIHGAFLMPAGLRYGLLSDLEGKTRIKDQVVDMGAYEGHLRLDQSITVSDITKTYGDAAFKPGFNASSGLQVSYLSSDNTIAEAFQDAVDGNAWKIEIKKAGIVTFVVTQPGNDDYFEAPAKNFTLTINKASQVITWNQTNLEAGCNGVAAIQLTATSNSGLAVSYTVSSPLVAAINGNLLTPVNGGAATITASQPGDQNHEAAVAVEKTFASRLTSAIRQHFSDLLIFDNTGNNYVQWQWYKDGAAVPGATQAYYSNTGGMNGEYYVMAKDKNGNNVQTCPLTVNGSASVKGIKASPNPGTAGSSVVVSCSCDAAALQGAKLIITGMSGVVVQQIAVVNPVTQIQAPDAGGVYTITLILSNGQKFTTNLLVK